MELLSEQLTVEGVELLINSGQVDIQSADGVELLVSCGARGHISAARALCASLRRRSLQIELLLTSKSLPRFLLLLRRLRHRLCLRCYHRYHHREASLDFAASHGSPCYVWLSYGCRSTSAEAPICTDPNSPRGATSTVECRVRLLHAIIYVPWRRRTNLRCRR